MDKLSTLFTAIGDTLNGTSWFPLVQWPFWALMLLVAVGGVYRARFDKNTLFCQGIQGALKLICVYMAALMTGLFLDSFLPNLTYFPFLSISDKTLTLVNPLTLLDKWKTTLPQASVHLYFLLFFINLVSVFDYNGKNFLTWFLWQIVSCLFPVGMCFAFSFCFQSFFPVLTSLFPSVAAILLIAFGILILLWKVILLLFRKEGNHMFTVIYTFITKQKFGSRITVTYLSWLIASGALFLLDLVGKSKIALDAVNPIAFTMIGIMTTLTLYVFNMFYCKRD